MEIESSTMNGIKDHENETTGDPPVPDVNTMFMQRWMNWVSRGRS